ncbi:MAG: alanine--glyoxylate aminotransferase family protein [Candidatus Omnitrophica bacterium]|nr:alanine--glyoxylate aminotransferase family protein [Candidatus Omnitrophota bacterium]
MKHTYLMTPGPSPLAGPVKEALAKDIIHHRTDEFKKILQEAHQGLKYVFSTDNPVLILACSGTGAMEASVSNLLSRNDKALVIVGGKFGQRWKDICSSYGVETVCMEINWGTSPDPKEIERILNDSPDIKAVYTTLCETSTATVYDIKAIASITRDRDVLLIVDAISGLGQDVLKTDEWGVDVVVSGSQKGLMLPPGLSFISLNRKAEVALATSNLAKYYFSLKKALKSYQNDDTPYTPSVSLVVALNESLKIIKEDGLENRWKEFQKIAQATQDALKELGFSIFSKSPSFSVTAAAIEGIDTQAIVKKMRKEYGISIAGGQDALKGKIIRIAHMGYINSQDVIMCLSILEKVLADLGASIEIGSSLKAFQEAYYG